MPSPFSVLKVRRTKLTSAGTWGKAELWRGPLCMFRCHTLELPWKDNRRGVSCIPDGLYDMALTMSPRFGTRLWEVLDVPNRSGIRIHAANYVHQLKGCIALGLNTIDIDGDGVLDLSSSREAMERFHTAASTGPLSLLVSHA